MKREKKQQQDRKNNIYILKDKANIMLLMLTMKSRDKSMNCKWPKINLLIHPIQKDFQENSLNFDLFNFICINLFNISIFFFT